MEKAIREDRKNKTRRLKWLEAINQNPNDWHFLGLLNNQAIFERSDNRKFAIDLPWKPGDILWAFSGEKPTDVMPLSLRVKLIRVERLQEITDEEVVEEGIEDLPFGNIDEFKMLWDSIYLDQGYGWNRNPWVWVLEFERVNREKSKDIIRIRMLQNVRPDLIFLAKPGTILRVGLEYDGMTNQNGAISGLCENGEYLGVKPGEFEFIKAPEWVLAIHNGLGAG